MTNLEIAAECGAYTFGDGRLEFQDYELAAFAERIQTAAYAEGRADQAKDDASKCDAIAVAADECWELIADPTSQGEYIGADKCASAIRSQPEPIA